jgi:putative transcriptional regulator
MQAVRHNIHAARVTSAAIFMLAVNLLAAANAAAQVPGPGQLLVATEEVRGPFFRETVVLLLHFDEHGAQGLVINRPMPATPNEVLPDLAGIERYEGTLYWGGPVQLGSLRVLMRTNDPPRDSFHIFGDVYLFALEKDLPDGAWDASGLRFFIGYAGWGAGQLDMELLRDSWRVLPATDDLVFTEDTAGIWRRLMPPSTIRAATGDAPSWAAYTTMGVD